MVCIMISKVKITGKVFIRHHDGASDVIDINGDDFHSIWILVLL